MNKLLKKLACTSALALACATPVHAAPITLIATWSGLHLDNTATATGHFVMEREAIGDFILDFDYVHSLLLTGQGSFQKSDYSFGYAMGMQSLDFTRELIGQILPNGCAFGTSSGYCGDGNGGDFNLFAAPGSAAPNGDWYFMLRYASGERMQLMSLKPVDVPEPGSLALAGIAFMGAAAVKWRKKRYGAV